MRHTLRRPIPFLLLAAGALISCSDTTNPSPAPNLEGTFAASSFTTTTAGGTIDRIAEGLTFTITLKADGTTEGSVSAAGQTVDVVGTWDTTQSVLRFHQDAPNFLGELPFNIRPNQLLSDATYGVTRFRVTLTREAPPR